MNSTNWKNLLLGVFLILFAPACKQAEKNEFASAPTPLLWTEISEKEFLELAKQSHKGFSPKAYNCPDQGKAMYAWFSGANQIRPLILDAFLKDRYGDIFGCVLPPKPNEAIEFRRRRYENSRPEVQQEVLNTLWYIKSGEFIRPTCPERIRRDLRHTTLRSCEYTVQGIGEYDFDRKMFPLVFDTNSLEIDFPPWPDISIHEEDLTQAEKLSAKYGGSDWRSGSWERETEILFGVESIEPDGNSIVINADPIAFRFLLYKRQGYARKPETLFVYKAEQKSVP